MNTSSLMLITAVLYGAALPAAADAQERATRLSAPAQSTRVTPLQAQDTSSILTSEPLSADKEAGTSVTQSLMDAQQDSLAANHKIVYIDGRPASRTQQHLDSIRSLIDHFYYDQFRHFQDPAAPYFLFMSKDASLAMGIGGCVRMRGWYEWGGVVPINGFSPYAIPMTPNPARMRRFGTTPSGSTLFFRVIGRNKTLGNYQLYIEANFNGYQGVDFHLKKAYAVINDWTIGYASSTFSDPAALPPTVDASGPNNKISPTSVLVRWMKPVSSRWTVAASLETPSSQASVDDTLTQKCDNWLPDAAAFIQYEWGRSQHVRLSGIVRTLPYRDMVQGRNHNVIGWGLLLSSIMHPGKAWTVYANICGGHGYEGLGGDLQMGNYDLIPDPRHGGELYAPAAMGWNLGVQYNFRPNLFTSVSYSQTRYMPRSGVAPSEYKFGQYMAANVFWNLTPRIQVGAELNVGMRQNMDGAHRWARRVGAMAQFSF
ncbi:MAG: hypothetical protein NC043_05795 [Muribaculaceae bacterium]|nr:hypothetical protein [Muribaculaceae bacterium]